MLAAGPGLHAWAKDLVSHAQVHARGGGLGIAGELSRVIQ